jgi:O-acetylserine/cysteine efflux transporter
MRESRHHLVMRLKTLGLALAAPLCWGLSFTLAKPAVAHFPPLFMLLMVYGAIAIFMSVIHRGAFKTPWTHLLLISALAVTIQGALLFYAVRLVDATTANLVLQTQVPAGVIMGWLIAGEKLTPSKTLGTLIAVLGVVVVIGLPENRPPLVPVLMIVLSGFVWAAGQVYARLLSKDPGLMILKANAIFSLPQLAIATLLLESGQWQSLVTATWGEGLLLLFVGFVGFYLAYMAWYSALKVLRVEQAVPFILLMTPIGLVSAVLFLGEHLSGLQILGGAVLMLGLAIVNDLHRFIFFASAQKDAA